MPQALGHASTRSSSALTGIEGVVLGRPTECGGRGGVPDAEIRRAERCVYPRHGKWSRNEQEGKTPYPEAGGKEEERAQGKQEDGTSVKGRSIRQGKNAVLTGAGQKTAGSRGLPSAVRSPRYHSSPSLENMFSRPYGTCGLDLDAGRRLCHLDEGAGDVVAGAVEVGRVHAAKSRPNAFTRLEDAVLDLFVGVVALERNSAMARAEMLMSILKLLVLQGGPVLVRSIDVQRLTVRKGRTRRRGGGGAHVLLEGGNHGGQRSVGLRLHKPVREDYATTKVTAVSSRQRGQLRTCSSRGGQGQLR